MCVNMFAIRFLQSNFLFIIIQNCILEVLFGQLGHFKIFIHENCGVIFNFEL